MLYPPILANTQPVIDINNAVVSINYQLASITSWDDFTHIEVFIAQQSNGKSILKNKTLIFSKEAVSDGIINVNKNNFETGKWKAGFLYKIQLRLRKESNNSTDVSEWSTVMIIKVISIPELSLALEGNVLLSDAVNKVYSLTPMIKGVCSIPLENKEVETRYSFKIRQGETLVTESGWQNHEIGQDDIWYCDIILDHQNSYFVDYAIETNNGYTATVSFGFVALDSAIGQIPFSLRALPNKINARIDLILSVTNPSILELLGNYVISRSSDKDNFVKWEDIKFVNFVQQSATSAFIVFSDYTIESGISYQYALQEILSNKRRSAKVVSNAASVDFEYGYLYRDGVQLRLSLNEKISSFKHTVLRNKQDTIGSKYPHLMQNGNAYYREFSLSGLISYQGNMSESIPKKDEFLDTSSTFFQIKANDGVYYKGEKIISEDKFIIREGKTLGGEPNSDADINPADFLPFDHFQSYNPNKVYFDENSQKYQYDNLSDPSDVYPNPREEADSIFEPTGIFASEGDKDFSIDYNLTDNNIFIERKFREKVQEFLNEFNYKLYKSPTEGNIVIALMNVSFQPIQSLGRMLYEFSATAYEVLDNNLSELNKYHIINTGTEISIFELVQPTVSFGQLLITSSNFDNITTKIELRDLIAEQQQFVVESSGIFTNYKYNLSSVESLWIEPLNKQNINDSFAKIYLNKQNNQCFWIPLTKVFTLHDLTSVSSIELENLNTPLVINYVCHNEIEKNENSIRQFGPVENYYDFDQVIWNSLTDQWDGDLLAFIKHELRNKLQIQTINHDNTNNETWEKQVDKKIYSYQFIYLKFIDIETQQGARITIGTSAQDKDSFIVGEYINSSRIFFTNLVETNQRHANYLHIENAQEAIINFVFYMQKAEIITETQEEGGS